MQLLVSVQNVEEALIALNAGVDIIDLKDPANGALGALDLITSAEVVRRTQQHNQQKIDNDESFLPILTSATVGEHHANLEALMHSMVERVNIHIDIVKVAVSSLESIDDWQEKLTLQEIFRQNSNIKIIAVFFADKKINLHLFEILKNKGFYGVMLDTSDKGKSLFDICTIKTINMFKQASEVWSLSSGLAGSLSEKDLPLLYQIHPTYVGFRGGLCEEKARTNRLVKEKVDIVRILLHEHNKFNYLTRNAQTNIAC